MPLHIELFECHGGGGALKYLKTLSFVASSVKWVSEAGFRPTCLCNFPKRQVSLVYFYAELQALCAIKHQRSPGLSRLAATWGAAWPRAVQWTIRHSLFICLFIIYHYNARRNRLTCHSIFNI